MAQTIQTIRWAGNPGDLTLNPVGVEATAEIGASTYAPTLLPAGVQATAELGTPAVSGGSTYPEEPVGYVRFAEWDCKTRPANSGGAGTVYNDTNPVRFGKWANSNNPAHAHLYTDADASPNTAPTGMLRAKFSAGLAAGVGPTQMQGWDSAGGDGEPAAVKSGWYMSQLFRLTSGSGDGKWQSQTVGTKIPGFIAFGVNAPDGSQNEGYLLIVPGTGGANATSFKTDFRLQNVSGAGSLSGPGGNMPPNIVTTQLLTVDTLHRLSWQFVINTVDVNDGIFRQWIDGVLTTQYTDVKYRVTGATQKFNLWKWNPTWGGSGGDTVTVDQWMDLDHVYMSGVA